VYSFVKNVLAPVYQRINYTFLPLTINKKPVLKLDKTVVGRFIVSTANGLFLVEDNTIFELLEGNFYGVTIWRNTVLVYMTYGHKGRIISFPLKSEMVKEKCSYVLNGLPHGCHQIDCVHDNLYITDTYNNRIKQFGLLTHKRIYHYPLGVLPNGRNSSNYAHINSIFLRQ
jgi:hypothetical protein